MKQKIYKNNFCGPYEPEHCDFRTNWYRVAGEEYESRHNRCQEAAVQTGNSYRNICRTLKNHLHDVHQGRQFRACGVCAVGEPFFGGRIHSRCTGELSEQKGVGVQLVARNGSTIAHVRPKCYVAFQVHLRLGFDRQGANHHLRLN